jgi:hypothetical protein
MLLGVDEYADPIGEWQFRAQVTLALLAKGIQRMVERLRAD